MYKQKIVVRCFWWMMNYWQPRLRGSGRVGRYITNKFLSSAVFGVGLATQTIGNLIHQWRLVRGTMYNQKIVLVEETFLGYHAFRGGVREAPCITNKMSLSVVFGVWVCCRNNLELCPSLAVGARAHVCSKSCRCQLLVEEKLSGFILFVVAEVRAHV